MAEVAAMADVGEGELQDSDESEGSDSDELDESEVEHTEVEGKGKAATVLTEDDALIDEDESGWLMDPDVDGQERYFDGTEWTDQVRPVDDEPDFRGRLHLPDHVPELQRALAAATADIDNVEARLSTLFDRGQGKWGHGVAESAGARPAADRGRPIPEEFDGEDSNQVDGDPISTGGERAELFSDDDDDDTFAELDAALAAEEPEKPERRFFKRRS